MKKKLEEISSWLFKEGVGVTKDVLNKKLEEVYLQGLLDAEQSYINTTLDSILSDTIQDIEKQMKVLCEKNFYNVPSEKDVIEMKAYKYLIEKLPEIVIKNRNRCTFFSEDEFSAEKNYQRDQGSAVQLKLV